MWLPYTPSPIPVALMQLQRAAHSTMNATNDERGPIVRFSSPRFQYHLRNPVYKIDRHQSRDEIVHRRLVHDSFIGAAGAPRRYRKFESHGLPDPLRPYSKMFLAFHACPTMDIARSIVTEGFKMLQQEDQGYFGAGLYFTLDLEYAVHSYGKPDDAGLVTVIVAAVGASSMLPIIERARQDSRGQCFLGVPKDDGAGFDTNVTVIDANDEFQPASADRLRAMRPGDDLFSELVAFSPEQVFPVGILRLSLTNKVHDGTANEAIIDDVGPVEDRVHGGATEQDIFNAIPGGMAGGGLRELAKARDMAKGLHVPPVPEYQPAGPLQPRVPLDMKAAAATWAAPRPSAPPAAMGTAPRASAPPAAMGTAPRASAPPADTGALPRPSAPPGISQHTINAKTPLLHAEGGHAGGGGGWVV